DVDKLVKVELSVDAKPVSSLSSDDLPSASSSSSASATPLLNINIDTAPIATTPSAASLSAGAATAPVLPLLPSPATLRIVCYTRWLTDFLAPICMCRSVSKAVAAEALAAKVALEQQQQQQQQQQHATTTTSATGLVSAASHRRQHSQLPDPCSSRFTLF